MQIYTVSQHDFLLIWTSAESVSLWGSGPTPHSQIWRAHCMANRPAGPSFAEILMGAAVGKHSSLESHCCDISSAGVTKAFLRAKMNIHHDRNSWNVPIVFSQFLIRNVKYSIARSIVLLTGFYTKYYRRGTAAVGWVKSQSP